VGTRTSRLVLFAERIDGYRIRVEGARDLTSGVFVTIQTEDDIGGTIDVDLNGLAIGQVAYEKGIVSREEFGQLPKTAFGCRP
jgi:hypothetical protein